MKTLPGILSKFEIIDTSHLYHHEHDADKLKQAIAKELMGIIGEDDEAVRGSTQSPDNPKYWTKKTAHRNELRAEQKKRLEEWLHG